MCMRNKEKCFACGKPLKGIGILVDTHEDQQPYVGPECARKIKKTGEIGYQPPSGGPRLWWINKV